MRSAVLFAAGLGESERIPWRRRSERKKWAFSNNPALASHDKRVRAPKPLKGWNRMNFSVYERPCLLLETAELVYALVNQLPPEEFTRERPCCIPAPEASKIQAQVCQGIDPSDEELQFYFKGVPIENRVGRTSCLACALLYIHPPIEYYELDDALEFLRSNWFRDKRPYAVEGISGFSLTLMEAEQYTNLSREISKLPVPQSYQAQLIEVFSGYDWHVERVCNILRPLVGRLKPLLEPWVAAAAPRRREWERFWSTPEANEFLQNRINVSSENVEELKVTMRYFSPQLGTGDFSVDTGVMRIHIGLAVSLHDSAPEARKEMEDWEYSALRNLTRRECAEIFRALRKKPKCIQDLAQELSLNPGTVFRNVNSMYSAGLVNLELMGGRNYYRANTDRLEAVTAHLVQYLKEN